MRPAVKAGLIGAGVAIVLTLLGLIPVCGCFAEPLIWLAYAGAGGLAAHYMFTSRPVTPSYAPSPIDAAEPITAGGVGVYRQPPAEPVRPAGSPAGEGALAGLITAVIQGIVRVGLSPLSLSLSGGPQAVIRQLPPESVRALTDAGIDPATLFGTGAFFAYSAVCCGIGIVAAVALGAIGGLIYGAIRKA